MTDVLSCDERHKCMSAIRSKNTKPEWVVRRTVFSLGYRYRLHVKTLPSKPDLVFPSRHKIIFVHGCFWHRHHCKKGKSIPNTNKEFWERKLEANVARDKRARAELRRMGWKVLVVWECQTKEKSLLSRLIKFLESEA